MTKLLERALEEVRKLPPSDQDAVAAEILRRIEVLTAPRLTPEQEAEARASIEAQDFLSDEEFEALCRKYGA
jgi:phage FluMu gp28-like protein